MWSPTIPRPLPTSSTASTGPNLTTIYRLEVALDQRLWHNQDFRRPWQGPAAEALPDVVYSTLARTGDTDGPGVLVHIQTDDEINAFALSPASGSPPYAGGAAGWVADNLEVIRMALEEAHQPLSVATLHRWHARLMRNSGLSSEFIGSFRPRVGWVGGSSPLDAAYVPPPPGEIPELVDDLLSFADSGAGLDPVSHTAILHAQFEAIHPYADGNGRLGRILVTRALRRADLTRRTTAPVSVAIARDPGGYLSGLAQFEQGHAGPWIRWFAEVAEKAAAATGSLATQTRHITEAWTRKLNGLRADSAARALVPLLAGHPVLCAPDAAGLLGVSRPAARAALRALTDRGVLAPVEADSPGVGRNRHWFAAIDLINTRSS